MGRKQLHLQGMRGVAICSVILFHYFPARFPNGYLGVDLFFVLSGDLMSMMLSSHTSLTFSIVVDFLYRRLKRIVPFYYLVVLLTTCSLIFLPFSNITPNLASSWNAILLNTNLVKNGDMGYFEKLGLTKDMFTHTWSLCLEMQFYLLFPFIWMAQTRFSDFPRIIFLYVICAISIAFYVLSDDFTSFNNVGSRIWQFLFGNVVYLIENKKNVENSQSCSSFLNSESQVLGEEESLLKAGHFQSKVSAEWVTTSFAFVLLIFTSISTEHLAKDYARVTTTIISSIMILSGRQFFLLECKPIVYLGEISYSWYLVHWPMVSAQKLLEMDTTDNMMMGVIVSFGVAVAFHFVFEHRYLTWGKTSVFAFVVCTFLLTVGVIAVLQNYPVAPLENLTKNFTSLTKNEVKAYNIASGQNDQLQLRMQNCTYIPDINKWFGYCEYQHTNKERNNSILIIGNSWAANQASLLFQECGQHAGKMTVKAQPGTEVFYGKNDPYIKDVKRIRPDQLFIIARAVRFDEIRDLSSTRKVIKAASEKLKLYSTLVRDKIYILTVFPNFSRKIALILNTAIDKGIQPNNKDLLEGPRGTEMARKAMKDIVSNCTKCVLYDYVPSFEVNGTVLPYDSKNLISYYTTGKHLSTAGLEKVRHIYKEICEKI